MFDFGENLNLSLNTGSSKFENNSNILDQNLSQIFADYKEAQKIEETQINQKSKERKKNIKKKLTTSKSTSMIIKPSKPIVSSIPGRNVNKPKKQSPNLKLKHASKKKKKGPKIIIKKKIEKILPSSPKILNETFKENELEIKLNKEEVKSLDEYLLNEGSIYYNIVLLIII